MPKNVGGGYNKNRKKGYGKQEIISKIDEGQMFAQVTKNEGSHLMVLCTDNISRIGRLNGRMKKGARLALGAYVIISLRDFESDQKHCDIIGMGSPPHHIVNIFKKNNPVKYNDDFIFEEDSDNEFNDFEQSKHTTTKINQGNTSNLHPSVNDAEENTEALNFDDIWDDCEPNPAMIRKNEVSEKFCATSGNDEISSELRSGGLRRDWSDRHLPNPNEFCEFEDMSIEPIQLDKEIQQNFKKSDKKNKNNKNHARNNIAISDDINFDDI